MKAEVLDVTLNEVLLGDGYHGTTHRVQVRVMHGVRQLLHWVRCSGKKKFCDRYRGERKINTKFYNNIPILLFTVS